MNSRSDLARRDHDRAARLEPSRVDTLLKHDILHDRARP
jgi:hypothetical protein